MSGLISDAEPLRTDRMQMDAERFRDVVIRHQSMVYSIALRITGDCGVAEEVAQDVFLALHRSLEELQSEQHMEFWLRRVAVQRARDAVRRRRLRPEASAEEWQEGRYDPGLRADRGTAADLRLEEMLCTLPEPQRVAILLRYQEEMRPEEIARLLGQPVATVKSHLQRGMALLRRKADVMLKEFRRERV